MTYLGCYMLCSIDGDGEGHAISHDRLHGRYAHHLSVQIYQRSTRIATVGGCICLDVLCIGACQAQLDCLQTCDSIYRICNDFIP